MIRGSGVQTKINNVNKIIAAIDKLTGTEILVGIPRDTPEREVPKNEVEPVETIDNATLGYLMEFGVPEKNIPARPFLIPGVEGIKGQIISELRLAGRFAFEGDMRRMETKFKALGLIAQDAVQQKMEDGPFEPIAEVTKANRLRRRKAYQKASEKRKRAMMIKYLAGDFKPLIDTGSLQGAITFVVAKKER